jgi:ascorbate-specific PTS system EIIC-type component UlaA
MLSLQTKKEQVKKTYSYMVTTILLMIVVPVLLIGCAWITQHPYIGALGFLLALFILWMARNWIGTYIFLTTFGFVLYVGPILNDLFMETSGERKTAIIADVQRTSNYSYDQFDIDWDCKLVTTEGKPIRYTLTETAGCWGKVKV